MVEIYPRCQSRPISDSFLRVLTAGWDEVFKQLQERGVGGIAELEGLEVTLLDDDEMTRLHGEFLNDATSTDVITFSHGELLIGVETAERQANDFGTSADQEIALYGIHGMLHLSGFDDKDSDDAKLMDMQQEELFREVFRPIFQNEALFLSQSDATD